MNFFVDKNIREISAVMYSEKNILDYPLKIGDDCIIVHNPNATYPVDVNIFSFLRQYRAEYKTNGLDINMVK
jgi:hypothetical protein